MNINNYPINPILIVDDEVDVCDTYISILSFNGINNFISCQDSRKVMNILAKQKISIILLDLSMPFLSGQELLLKIEEEYPGIPIFIITGSDDIETIIDCLKKGAYDYIVKPVDETRLTTCIKHALTETELQQEVTNLNKSILSHSVKSPGIFSSIITNNHKMKHIFKYIEAIAESPKPVLITGESGTGKEIIAQTIHDLSGLTGEYVSINISGLDDTMFSDTLFGHSKGAFTGAIALRKGLIEQAREGTLFLDEIGDLEQSSQVKLLRLLQEKEYYMLGSDSVKSSDARIIVATNADLQEKQRSGEFRKDLYYRLVTHHIHLPPLRERPDDIPLLFDHFVEKAAQTLNKDQPEIPDKIYSLLANYMFPGNIRELEAMVFNAVSADDSPQLSIDFFCDHISKHLGTEVVSVETESGIVKIITSTGTLPTLKDVESYLIDEALKITNGNMTAAAHLIGLSPATMTRRLKDKD